MFIINFWFLTSKRATKIKQITVASKFSYCEWMEVLLVYLCKFPKLIIILTVIILTLQLN